MGGVSTRRNTQSQLVFSLSASPFCFLLHSIYCRGHTCMGAGSPRPCQALRSSRPIHERKCTSSTVPRTRKCLAFIEFLIEVLLVSGFIYPATHRILSFSLAPSHSFIRPALCRLPTRDEALPHWQRPQEQIYPALLLSLHILISMLSSNSSPTHITQNQILILKSEFSRYSEG